MGQERKTVLLVDGMAILHRAYHAMLRGETTEGKSAVFLDRMRRGMQTCASNLLREFVDFCSPDEVYFIYDASKRNWRHNIYADYKANRPSMPDLLREAMGGMRVQLLQDILETGREAFAYDAIDVEADDMIASTAALSNPEDCIFIASGDKDLQTVLRDGVSIMWKPSGKLEPIQVRTNVDFQSVYGFEPGFMPDYLALLGDRVDNVPGVPGIGESGAKRVIKALGSVESIYSALDENAKNVESALGKSLTSKLIHGRESAFLSRALTELRVDAGMNVFSHVQSTTKDIVAEHQEESPPAFNMF